MLCIKRYLFRVKCAKYFMDMPNISQKRVQWRTAKSSLVTKTCYFISCQWQTIKLWISCLWENWWMWFLPLYIKFKWMRQKTSLNNLLERKRDWLYLICDETLRIFSGHSIILIASTVRRAVLLGDDDCRVAITSLVNIQQRFLTPMLLPLQSCSGVGVGLQWPGPPMDWLRRWLDFTADWWVAAPQ